MPRGAPIGRAERQIAAVTSIMPAVASAAGSIQRSRRHRRRRNTGHVFLREGSDEERIADNRGECEIASDVGLPRAGRKTVVVVLTPERVAVNLVYFLV